MYTFIASLTANLLFIHAIVGCCWHAAHDCADHAKPAGQSAPAVSDCRQHCCHCHGSGHPSARHDAPDGQTPHHCQLECHGVCIYLPSPKPRLEVPRLVVPLDLALVPGRNCDGKLAIQAESPARLATPWAPAVRLHLLRRILLI